MTSYPTAAYIDPTPRRAGWHDVHVKVTWTSLHGGQRVIEGAFLDASSPDGPVFLACGIEDIAAALGLTYAIADPEHTIAVCELVTVQLEQHPYAELVCPEGQLRIELAHA